jgi:hypothetical protein
MSLSTIYETLMSPTLPPKILLAGGAIAVLILAIGISLWGVKGAWKALRYLLTM